MSNLHDKKHIKKMLKDACELSENPDTQDLAEELYDKVLRENPNNVEALTDLGSIYCNRDDYEEAFKLFLRAVMLAPRDAMCHYNVAIALWETEGTSYELDQHLITAVKLDHAYIKEEFVLERLSDTDIDILKREVTKSEGLSLMFFAALAGAGMSNYAKTQLKEKVPSKALVAESTHVN